MGHHWLTPLPPASTSSGASSQGSLEPRIIKRPWQNLYAIFLTHKARLYKFRIVEEDRHNTYFTSHTTVFLPDLAWPNPYLALAEENTFTMATVV